MDIQYAATIKFTARLIAGLGSSTFRLPDRRRTDHDRTRTTLPRTS